MKKQVFFFSFVILFATHFSCFAQFLISDTTTQAALQNAIKQYNNLIGPNASIYNGRKYLSFKGLTEGHPYFKHAEMRPATIQYEGVVYEGIPALYNAWHDEIIIGHLNTNEYKVKLFKERVDYFTIDGHTFINIKNHPTTGLPPKQVFYELLFAQEEVQVLARRHKKSSERLENRLVYTDFDQEYTYYVLKDSVYHQVKSKASVLKVFKEHKAELKRQLRKSNLRPYYSNREQAIIYLAKQYSALITLP